MRLLRHNSSGEFDLDTFKDDVPPYAILSHTWTDEEVTYDELVAGIGKNKAGYAKIRFCGERAVQDGIKYFWVDTCCINKSIKAEHQQAISSMFLWYRSAAKCYVYLSDVYTEEKAGTNAQGSWEQAFGKSRWFTRGWTLQELLAPASVEFFSAEGNLLGSRQSLEQQIHDSTALPTSALQGEYLSQFSVNERLSWTQSRQTKLEEDLAYSLLGIFGVNISLQYGEGKVKAFERLQSEIEKQEKCIRDLYITDPRDDKTRIEDTKGDLLEGSYCWVLENSDFQKWCSDQQSLLWIKGDPGKGKTMLLCGIINELEKRTVKQALVSYFFCQATDLRLNKATAVIRGLIYRLASQQPSLTSHIRERYDKVGKALFEDANAWVALSEILTSILQTHGLSETYIVIDALDECTVDLYKLLGFIARQSNSSSRVKWIVSSRNWPDIEEQLERAGYKIKLSLELNAKSVSAAVSFFIQHKVDRLAQEKKYDQKTRDAVSNLLSQNADNTFLWVALVCQDLAKVPRWNALNRLQNFPPGLDSLYGQMLERIRVSHCADLCTRILAILAVVYQPITLLELICLVDGLEDMSDDCEAVIQLVQYCGSFLTIRSDTIYFIHQSAKDFLLKVAPNQIFSSGTNEVHHIILQKSLQALSSTLRRDIYGLHALDYPINQVKSPDPDPLAAVRYACVFWVEHFCDGTSGLDIDHKRTFSRKQLIEMFIKKKYLYWLEALSLCGRLSEGITSIGKLEAFLQVNNPILSEAIANIVQVRKETDEFFKLIQDARRFILSHKLVIGNNPLQTYISVLIFSPSRSLIKENFKYEEPEWITMRPAINEWSACLQTLEGHSANVWSVGFSHDSTRLASASEDRTIRIWDADSGGCLQTLEGHSDGVWSVAFSHDSTRLASASEDRTIRIWDADSGGGCLQTLEGHSDGVWSVAFSHDSTRLASASEDHTIRIWDADSGGGGGGGCLQTLEGHSDGVQSVAFSHDSTRLASASWDRTIRIWDADSGGCLQTLEGHSDGVWSVAFSHDSSRLASASEDRTIRIWDADSGGGCLQTLEGHSDGVLSVALSHDSTRLASASRDRTIRIWDADSGGGCLQTLEGHSAGVRLVAFSHDSTRLASASGDGTIRIWDADSGGGGGGCLQTLEGHSNGVRLVAFSHDSTRLASASWGGTIRIWDADSGGGGGGCLQTLEGHSNGVLSVAFSHDSTRLASASWGGTIRIWDADSGACLQTLNIDKHLYEISFDATGSYLRTDFGIISIDNPPVSDKIWDEAQHGDPKYQRIGLSPDGEWITYDSKPCVWLPSEYRPSSSAVSWNTIGIGTGSGKRVMGRA